MNLDRARTEVDEALDQLEGLAEFTVAHVEGLVTSSTIGLEYATDLLENFVKDNTGETAPVTSNA